MENNTKKDNKEIYKAMVKMMMEGIVLIGREYWLERELVAIIWGKLIIYSKAITIIKIIKIIITKIMMITKIYIINGNTQQIN